jgi:hypothetical protein
MKPHRATMILIFGILSLIACAPLGIAAWVMGSGDIKEMDAGRMDPSGRSTTNAGKICGMIGTILMVVGIAIWGLIIMLAVVGGAASHTR